MVFGLLTLFWSTLSAIRTAQVVKIGYLGAIVTPIYANFLLAANLDDSIDLPLSLLFAFFGSLLLSVTHFLNELLCPSLIRRCSTLEEFRLYLHNYILYGATIEGAVKELKQQDTEEAIAQDHPQMSQGDIEAAASQILLAVGRVEKQMSSTRNDAKAKLITDYENNWNAKNESLTVFRFFISGGYAVSGVIMTSLIVLQVITVCRVIF